MKEVIVVCEGQTEEVFVREVLAPVLWLQDVYIDPRVISTSRHSKGGGKVRHGRVVSGRIGVDRMRAECAHFGGWMARLEALPPLRPDSQVPEIQDS